MKIINWLTIPTAIANLTNAIGGLFMPVNFYAVLDATRIAGIVIIAVSLPLLWWRFRHDDREALLGIAWAMLVVVLFVPAALPGTTPGRSRCSRRWHSRGRRSH